jgi:hypothetical protein
MNDDQNLKNLGKNLDVRPNDLDLQKWKIAVRAKKSELKRKKKNIWVQWGVAASFGFVLGAVVFSDHTFKPQPKSEAISFEQDATFEHVYTND